MTYRRKLIEVLSPLDEVNSESARERSADRGAWRERSVRRLACRPNL